MEGDRFGLAGGVTVGSWASSARLEARLSSFLRDEISADTISASSSSSAAASHAAAPVVAAAGGGSGGGGYLAADVEADLPGSVGSRVVVPGGGPAAARAAAPNVAFHTWYASSSSSAFVLATSFASASASAPAVAMARPTRPGGGWWPRAPRARDSWQQDGPRREAAPEADTDAAGRLVQSAPPPPETAAPISLCSAKVSASASASASAKEEAGVAEEAGAAGAAGARGEAGTAGEEAEAPSGDSFALGEFFALRTALRSNEFCLPRERLPELERRPELGGLSAGETTPRGVGVEGEVAVAPAEARRGDVASGARTGGGRRSAAASDEARRRLMAAAAEAASSANPPNPGDAGEGRRAAEEGLRAAGLRGAKSAVASDEARRRLMAAEAEAASSANPPKPALLVPTPREGEALWLTGFWSGAATSAGVEKSQPRRTCASIATDAARRGWLLLAEADGSPSGGCSFRGGSMSTCMRPCKRAAPSSVPSNAASARASASSLALLIGVGVGLRCVRNLHWALCTRGITPGSIAMLASIAVLCSVASRVARETQPSYLKGT